MNIPMFLKGHNSPKYINAVYFILDNYDRPFKVPIPVDDEMYIQMDTAVSRDHVLPTQDSIDLEITAAQSETVTECDYLVMGGSAPAVVAAPPSPPPPRPSPPPPPRPSPPPPRPMEPHPNSRPKLNSKCPPCYMHILATLPGTFCYVLDMDVFTEWAPALYSVER